MSRMVVWMLFAMIVMSPSLVLAQTKPVDAAVKAALYDIERAEKQSVGLTPKRKANIRRVVGMIEGAETRLESSTNKDHASWVEAKKRLDAVKARLAALTNPSPATPQASQAPTTPQPPTAGTPPSSQGPPALTKYDVDQLGTTDRQTDSLIKQVQQVDPVDFSLPEEQKRWRNHVQRMKDLYLKISQPQHPQALPVAQKISALEAFVEDQIKKASTAHAQLGDVKIRYDDIEKRLRTTSVPHAPTMPISKDQAVAFAKQLKALGAEAAEDHAYLQSIKGKTKVVYESQIDDLLHQTERRQSTVIPRASNILVKRLDDRITGIEQVVERIEKADLKNQTNMSQSDYHAKELKAGLEYIDTATAFEQELGIKPIDRSPKKLAFEKALTTLGKKTEAGLHAVRFPKVRSKDSELLKAAKEVLSDPAYKIHPIERMEITYDKQRKKSAEGDVDFGAAQTTVSVTGYVWDEFAVTTVEKVGNEYYLFSNLLKFFHEGGTDVPTGKWTLGKRDKGSQILKENIDK